jgi:hypothetical protein
MASRRARGGRDGSLAWTGKRAKNHHTANNKSNIGLRSFHFCRINQILLFNNIDGEVFVPQWAAVAVNVGKQP